MEIAQKIGSTIRFGTSPEKMLKGARLFGLPAQLRVGMTIDDLQKIRDNEQMVILLVQLEGEDHWVLMADIDNTSIYLMDPWSKDNYVINTHEQFELRWWSFYAQRVFYQHLGIVLSPPE